jgi:hypothetical protein
MVSGHQGWTCCDLIRVEMTVGAQVSNASHGWPTYAFEVDQRLSRYASIGRRLVCRSVDIMIPLQQGASIPLGHDSGGKPGVGPPIPVLFITSSQRHGGETIAGQASRRVERSCTDSLFQRNVVRWLSGFAPKSLPVELLTATVTNGQVCVAQLLIPNEKSNGMTRALQLRRPSEPCRQADEVRQRKSMCKWHRPERQTTSYVNFNSQKGELQ